MPKVVEIKTTPDEPGRDARGRRIPDRKAGRPSLNMGQLVQVADLLRSVCHKGEDGLAHYAEGQSDAAIAKAMPFDCSEKTVQRVRTQLIGKLPKAGPPTQVREAARFERIEARVLQLAGEHDQLDFFVRALCQHLGVDVQVVLQAAHLLQGPKEVT